MYFTTDNDAKGRIGSLNDIDKNNNLNTIRRASKNEDGIFDDCNCSDHEVGD